METKKTTFTLTAERQGANMALSNQLVSFVSGNSTFNPTIEFIKEAIANRGTATDIIFNTHVHYLRDAEDNLCTLKSIGVDVNGDIHIECLTESKPMLWNKSVFGYLENFRDA